MLMARSKYRVCLVATGLFAAVAVYLGCRSTPVTERRQVLLVPESQEIAMGVSAYQELLAEEVLSTNSHYTEMVNRVGQRIAAVAGRPDYAWEFRVIASDQQNAFALPGGKVAVYEGILPVCSNEAGLAVVMSHEIAHALARHGGERLSHGMVVNGAKRALDYFTKGQEAVYRERIMTAYGVASKYGVVLPYSRKQEAEADHIGLLLMAQAGYDPREAPAFWERFSRMGAGQKPPEFLSTHPSDATRAKNLRELLPKATELYAQAPVKYGFGEMLVVALPPGQPAYPPASMGPAATGFTSPAPAGWPPPR
jgi:predicted Zn-dependent protease